MEGNELEYILAVIGFLSIIGLVVAKSTGKKEKDYVVRAKNRFLGIPHVGMTVVSVDQAIHFNHQVAGHTSEVLRGFMGKILKPMVKGNLFLRELCLYEEMAESPVSEQYHHLPRDFVPQYFGLAMVEIHPSESSSIREKNKCMKKKDEENSMSNGDVSSQHHQRHLSHRLYSIFSQMYNKIVVGNNGLEHHLLTSSSNILPHLVLEDLTLGYLTPCVIDIKMGQQTYEPTASLYKKNREVLKCPHQVTTGFRITGMKVYDIQTQSYSYKEKYFGRSLAPAQLCDALTFFFHNGRNLRRDVVNGVIQQLEQILVWFQHQHQLHFYCSSLLIIYDGTPKIDNTTTDRGIDISARSSLPSTTTSSSSPSVDVVKVKMIDFAHTLPSPGGIDVGYIVGLRNLISNLQNVLQKS